MSGCSKTIPDRREGVSEGKPPVRPPQSVRHLSSVKLRSIRQLARLPESFNRLMHAKRGRDAVQAFSCGI